jgi:hypothetical protein
VPLARKKQGRLPTTCWVIATDDCDGSYTKIIASRGPNAWVNYIIGERWNIIFDIKPQHGFRILMDGLPGVITSNDDFGVNAAGLLITETTITSFEGFDPQGSPEFYRSRKALQYGSSIDEYVRMMLDGNNGGYANDWLIGDNKTGEIALFELGLKEHSLRRTKDGYFVGSNFPVDPLLAKRETTFDFSNKQGSPLSRKERWEDLIKEKKSVIDAGVVRQMEGDTRFVREDQRSNERISVVCRNLRARYSRWDWAKFYPGGFGAG